MKKLILALALLAGCRVEFANQQHACGDLAPVMIDGLDPSNHGKDCPGRWQPVPTGPWYRCECGEVKP